MRAFTLLVPAISLLTVKAATISNGMLSRQSHGLVARRQFHNADFNSGSSSSGHHGHHHGEHNDKESSSDPLSRRQVPSLPDTSALFDTSNLNIGLPSDAVSRRQVPSAAEGVITQATDLLGSTPAGSVLGTVSSTASRRQDVDTSGVTSEVATVVGSTPAGSLLGSASSTASRRQAPDVSGVTSQVSDTLGSTPAGSVAQSLTGAASRRQTIPELPVVGSVPPDVGASSVPSLDDVDLNDATNLGSLTSGTTATRALKDVAEEDIVAADEDIATADDDIEEDLKEVPPPLDVVPGYTELSPELTKESESASAVKEKRQTDLSALQAAVLDQELVQSLTSTNATG